MTERGAEGRADGPPSWLGVWIAAGALVGLVLPAGVLIAHRTEREAWRALAPSLLVLSGQAATERVLSGYGRGGWVPVVGGAGTLLRLGLMAAARRRLRRGTAPSAGQVAAVLDANLVFWSGNLLVLAAPVARRRVRRFSRSARPVGHA